MRGPCMRAAGLVPVSREVLRQRGLNGTRSALAYRLRAAGLGLLLRATRQAVTRVVGVWRQKEERRDIRLPDGVSWRGPGRPVNVAHHRGGAWLPRVRCGQQDGRATQGRAHCRLMEPSHVVRFL
ncbi:hypothetical protein GCM10010844_31910 [Deinococcus radiotolerans]|uniref:Transposase n=1 Tax=Deinococcus radiotolerans TaxID=1309407 RepID=A0ABQ2FNA9_9DEIO|nr:hypothetical protein GCM10010844_31910 [Deinococcus radiotolerans]